MAIGDSQWAVAEGWGFQISDLRFQRWGVRRLMGWRFGFWRKGGFADGDNQGGIVQEAEELDGFQIEGGQEEEKADEDADVGMDVPTDEQHGGAEAEEQSQTEEAEFGGDLGGGRFVRGSVHDR